MGIHVNRTPTPLDMPFKPGDFVKIRAYNGTWIIEEYLPPEGEGDLPRWSCREASAHDGSLDYPCWALGTKDRNAFVYITAGEHKLQRVEAYASENIVTGVESDCDGAVPGIWATLSGRTFPKYAASPLDVESFLKELYDMGAIICDEMHAKILDVSRDFGLKIAA